MYNRQFTTTLGPIISAACALLIVLGTMQPWQRTFTIATNGSETNQGFFCLILGVIAIAICLGRAFARLPRTAYLLTAFIVGAVALGLSSWFLYDLENATQGSFFGVEFEMTTPSSGIYLTVGGAIALLVSLFAQALIPDRRSALIEASQPPVGALSE